MKRILTIFLTLAAMTIFATVWYISPVKTSAQTITDKTKTVFSCVTAYPIADHNICVMNRDGDNVVKFTDPLTTEAEHQPISADAANPESAFDYWTRRPALNARRRRIRKAFTALTNLKSDAFISFALRAITTLSRPAIIFWN